MWTDVVDLKIFYESSLGHMVQDILSIHINKIWPSVADEKVAGLGYPLPYLDQLIGTPYSLAALMPARQGVLGWHSGVNIDSARQSDSYNQTVLVHEDGLPLPDQSITRFLLVHGLESTSVPDSMLREIWRVLADHGRLLVIVPNRRGVWARLDVTPFGQGHPFTLRQLRNTLRQNLFTPEETRSALFIPPKRSRLWQSTASTWEDLGTRWFRALSGVILMEASKEIYALPPLQHQGWTRIPGLKPELSTRSNSEKLT